MNKLIKYHNPFSNRGGVINTIMKYILAILGLLYALVVCPSLCGVDPGAAWENEDLRQESLPGFPDGLFFSRIRNPVVYSYRRQLFSNREWIVMGTVERKVLESLCVSESNTSLYDQIFLKEHPLSFISPPMPLVGSSTFRTIAQIAIQQYDCDTYIGVHNHHGFQDYPIPLLFENHPSYSYCLKSPLFLPIKDGKSLLMISIFYKSQHGL